MAFELRKPCTAVRQTTSVPADQLNPSGVVVALNGPKTLWTEFTLLPGGASNKARGDNRGG
jgi:hypothetical protein